MLLAPEIAGLSGIDADRAARRSLQAQIGRLEAELVAIPASTYPRVVAPPETAGGGPRLLGLAELERARDELAGRLATLRARAGAQARRQAEARERLRAMLAEPAAFKGERIANAELGLPGCTTYAVMPRLGPVGLLSGWWRVKISSGCPLPRP